MRRTHYDTLKFILSLLFWMSCHQSVFGQDTLNTDYPFLHKVVLHGSVGHDSATNFYYYMYTLMNDSSSKGSISQFRLDISRDSSSFSYDTLGLQFSSSYMEGTFRNNYSGLSRSIIPVGFPSLPARWTGTFGNSPDAWFDIDTLELEPGNSLSGFVMMSKGLPSIRRFLAEPEVNIYEFFPSLEDTAQTMTIKQVDSVTTELNYIGLTIAPSALDSPFVAVNFLDTLISYTTRSRTLGWILSQSVANKYDGLFTMAKSDLQQDGIATAEMRLDTVLQQIPIDSVSGLTSEAYALLKFNTEYLKSQFTTRANVKVFLQGPTVSSGDSMSIALKTGGYLATHFAGLSIPSLAVDSINIELRDSASATAPTIRHSPAWLLSNGTIKDFSDTTRSYVEFGATLPGQYYVVINQRDHLSIMTAQRQLLDPTTIAAYNFTTSQSQAYGASPLKQIGSKYTMYTGDIDRDGGVGASDKVLAQAATGQSGYLVEDVTLNTLVNAADRSAIQSNTGRISQVPQDTLGLRAGNEEIFEVRIVQRVGANSDSVDIEIRRLSAEPFVLGTSSFVLDYNNAALGTPTKLDAKDGPWDANKDRDYDDIALNKDDAGYAGLSIDFLGGVDNNGPVVPISFTRIGSLRFPIKNGAARPNFSWRVVGVSTQVFKITNPGRRGGGETAITYEGSFIPPRN